jgi:hypothetical protein
MRRLESGYRNSGCEGCHDKVSRTDRGEYACGEYPPENRIYPYETDILVCRVKPRANTADALTDRASGKVELIVVY